MNNPKRENLLNLALDATPVEREKSLELSVGYEAAERTWEVIVRYSGSLDELEREFPQMTVTRLMNQYAVIVLPESLLEVLTARVEIEYIEKPKRLFFSVNQGIGASCIRPLYGNRYNLSGRGVIVGVIDSGERVIIMSS